MKEYEELDTFINTIDSSESLEGSLIKVLHKAQALYGYLSNDTQLFIARKLGISTAKVNGVVTFYSYFTTKPQGKHIINVCMGTACFVRGSNKIIEALKEKLEIESNETTKDGLFTLKDVRCIGACGLAPIVLIDDKVYGNVKVEDLDVIIDEHKD
ncbi:complex I 24 kDa subunit family protein [Abyssisolibacter fermentans]|uniref:NADH-quinone oxidoreductase subunit NuoE family protein n=1 Tax=Abyssisolibacter fermentans TaxID=1766203 RepID=UPI00082D9732|nr:NAD(P)H-dependent oxidoreductase subunit E [Abyssisolibacter fermentans]